MHISSSVGSGTTAAFQPRRCRLDPEYPPPTLTAGYGAVGVMVRIAGVFARSSPAGKVWAGRLPMATP